MFVPRASGNIFTSMSEQKRKYSVFYSQRSSLRLIGIAVAVLVLAACQEVVETQQTIRPVKAVVAYQTSGENLKSFSGEIKAKTESTLGFRVPGKIVQRFVDIGDRVKAGQVIARLDGTDLVLSENSARAAVRSAKTRLAVAKDALVRAQKLRPKGYTPEAAVDQRRLEVDAAQAALESAEAQAEQASNATSYAVLQADTDGIVTDVRAEAGQVVAAGSPAIIIAEAGEKELALNVPEQDVARLAIGQKAALSLWADPAIKTEGKISEIAGQADPGSRTYAVRVAISAAPPAMRLGMTATAILTLGSQAPYFPVPITALTEIDGRKAIFVADRNTSKVVPRFIEIDGVAPDALKVISGIKPGEVVITGGVQFLTDGMQVKLPEDVMKTASAGSDETKS